MTAPRMFLGVKGKLIGLLVGTAFLALLASCFAFAYYDRVSYTAARQQTLGVLVDSVAQSSFGPAAFQDPDSARVILKVLEAEPMALSGAIYLKDGAALTHWQRAGGFALPERGDKLVAPAALWIIRSDIKNPEQTVGYLAVAFDTRDVAARTRKFIQIAAAVLAVAALAAFLLATLAQRVLTRPVQLLSEAARRVREEKDFETRATKVSNDELGELTDAFNDMLVTIQTRDKELESHRLHLEDLVNERTQELNVKNEEMRLVLDNVDQGFVTLDREGKIGVERSATFSRWFPIASKTPILADILESRTPGIRDHYAMCFAELIDGLLPFEVNLAQLPAYIDTEDDRHFHVGYTPIGRNGDHFERLLVVMSDITEEVNLKRSEAEQAQIMSVFEHVSRDRAGVVEFLNEAQGTLVRLTGDTPGELRGVLRDLHTLKGNFGLFGLKPLATLVHRIEGECLDSGEPPAPDHRSELQSAWKRFAERVSIFLGADSTAITISPEELDALQGAVTSGASNASILEALQRLQSEPVEPKLERLASRARDLAVRLGKGDLQIVVDAKGVRQPTGLQGLWQAMPHLVANAVDHGIVPQALSDRVPRLTLTAKELPGSLVVEVADNGAGIDWERLRAKAKAAGHPYRTHEDLVAALFTDGLSTRDDATEVSGRGVGLAAVKAALDARHGSIVVDSEPGRGTRFELRVPMVVASVPAPALKDSAQERWSTPPAQRASIRPRMTLAPSS